MAPAPSTPSLAVTCRQCQHKFEQPLGWLKKNLEFYCPHCDGTITVDKATIAEAEAALGVTERAAILDGPTKRGSTGKKA